MSNRKSNLDLIVNLIGNIWFALLNFISIPIYLHFLGVEAFGFIGIYNSIFAATILLDLGISPALNREIARLNAIENQEVEIKSLIFSVELVYWIVAGILCVVLYVIAPFLASSWVSLDQITYDEAELVFIMMSLAIMVQLPTNFYVNILQGFEKHFQLNSANIMAYAFRFGSTILALKYIAGTLYIFFCFQIISSLIHVALLRVVVWFQESNYFGKRIFSFSYFARIKKFAIGIGGYTITEFFISQADKIILSALLPMKTFGYYVIASSFAKIISLFGRPIGNVIFPRFSVLIKKHELEILTNQYHYFSKIASILIYPFTFFVFIFSEDVLFLWTKDAFVSTNSSLLLKYLIVGNCFYAIVKSPIILYLSHGRSKIILTQNLIAIIFFLPWLILATPTIGALSSPIGWMLTYLMIFLFTPIFIHKHHLPGELMRWYFADNFKFIFASLSALLIVSHLATYYISTSSLFLSISLIFTYLFALLVDKEIRQSLFKLLNKY